MFALSFKALARSDISLIPSWMDPKPLTFCGKLFVFSRSWSRRDAAGGSWAITELSLFDPAPPAVEELEFGRDATVRPALEVLLGIVFASWLPEALKPENANGSELVDITC